MSFKKALLAVTAAASLFAAGAANAAYTQSATDFSAARYMIMKNGEPIHTLTRITPSTAMP